MPAIADLALTDSVPEARDFVPSNIKGNVATYLDKATNGGVAAGYAVLTHSHSDPSKTSRNSKTRIKLMVPRLDTVTGLVVSRCSADVTFLCDDMSSEIDRNNLLYLFKSALESDLGNTVTTNDSMY